MSLLQDVLRSKTDDIDRRLRNVKLTRSAQLDNDDSDDEIVNVVRPSPRSLSNLFFKSSIYNRKISLPGTPALTRPSSPARGGGNSSRLIRGPLLLSSTTSHDPLKAFPTELSQRIFFKLPIRDLARCALVSKKWARSQSLNYGNTGFFTFFSIAWELNVWISFTVWFRYYRKEHFHDDSLPPGKWTKRESKQNWVSKPQIIPSPPS